MSSGRGRRTKNCSRSARGGDPRRRRRPGARTCGVTNGLASSRQPDRRLIYCADPHADSFKRQYLSSSGRARSRRARGARRAAASHSAQWQRARPGGILNPADVRCWPARACSRVVQESHTAHRRTVVLRTCSHRSAVNASPCTRICQVLPRIAWCECDGRMEEASVVCTVCTNRCGAQPYAVSICEGMLHIIGSASHVQRCGAPLRFCRADDRHVFWSLCGVPPLRQRTIDDD